MGKITKLTKMDNKKSTGAKKKVAESNSIKEKAKKQSKGKTNDNAKSKKKVSLHRYPSKRQFTDKWWVIPIGTWILITGALCGVSTQYADFNWMSDLKSLNYSCSAMHRHLAAYVLNYTSYLIALLGSFALSLGFSFMFQHLTVIAMQISWYLCILTTTAYVLALWFVIPINQELTCGQAVFSIAITIAYIILIFLMFSNRNRMPLTETLHMVTKTIYRDLPCVRIALVTFVFQLICIALNVLSMAVAVSVLQKSTELGNYLLTMMYTICFMLLEGWLFIIFISCNKFAVGYCVGLWYFAKKKSNVKGMGSSFGAIFYHIATLSTGSIYLSLHTIFHPIIDSIYYGNTTGVEGIIRTISTALLQPYKNTYDTINQYGFYIVAIYGVDYYAAMQRSFNLMKIGEANMVKLLGDSYVYTCILVISSSSLAFGLAYNPDERMRWWKNVVLLFFTGLWVSCSFLLTFKHVNSAFYMCICMDYEVNDGIKKPYKYPKALLKYMAEKEEFGLTGRLKFRVKRKRKPIFTKKTLKKK